MLRTERSRLSAAIGSQGRSNLSPRELLLAIAPPPTHSHSFALTGWPTWLVPRFRSSARTAKHLDLSPNERED
jgi:hypothetical protein